ncbi:MAG: carboxypeptidase regulatory-like domain-containing protein [Proteobacteria bacterium]|nr:carboxypeptidase regulatory-like domain-containing protein [Pseudomonadota bacterium]
MTVVSSLVACGSPPNRNVPGIDAPPEKMDACSGLECRRVDCAAMGMPPTSISGTVYAPNETLALYGVNVYVPNLAPGPFLPGVKCDQCDPNLPGEPIVRAISDEAGAFKLDNVPVGTEVPLVITTGKWRRIVTIPNVMQCTDNPLPANLTRLPRNKSEGDLPKIAISTGGCDALECLVRKLGVSDGEFTDGAGTGRVHLFHGAGGATSIQSSGAALTTSDATLWNNLDKMKEYDLQLYSCECGRDFSNKTAAALDNVKAYADAGGRVFMSHYHNVWLEGDATHPTTWSNIATCQADSLADGTDIIDQVANPKGTSFATWMVNVQGSTTLGSIAITEGKETCTAIDAAKAERWVYTGGTNAPQNFQFTTPQELDKKDRCGKVVFSDMHVASGSSSSGAFPSGCAAATDPLSPQEKALAFMFFDIATCVGVISKE